MRAALGASGAEDGLLAYENNVLGMVAQRNSPRAWGFSQRAWPPKTLPGIATRSLSARPGRKPVSAMGGVRAQGKYKNAVDKVQEEAKKAVDKDNPNT